MGRYARNSIGQYAPVGAAADDLPGGATPTGKKTIDTTAEVDVASYATAQVVDENLTAENIRKDVSVLGISGEFEGGGGGLSDFSTAEVTVTLTNANAGFFGVCLINDGGDVFLSTACEMEESGTLMAVLYGDNPTIFESAFSEGASVAVSGGVTYSNGVFTVSGEGSITITDDK